MKVLPLFSLVPLVTLMALSPLAMLPSSAMAQAGSVAPNTTAARASEPDAAQSWRKANDVVGQFLRGHADIVRWEQQQSAASSNTPDAGKTVAAAGSNADTTKGASPDGMAVLDLTQSADAVRRAWSLHRELAAPLIQIGPENSARLAAGQWDALDGAMLRRVEHFDELLEVAALTRKAWTQAVAAQQTVQTLQRAQEAAEAAQELGKRMVAVGNWSRLQQAPTELALAQARMNLLRAHYAAAQAQAPLRKLLGISGVGGVSGVSHPSGMNSAPVPLVLPLTLQSLASAGSTPDNDAAMEQALQKALRHTPIGDQAKLRANAQLAFHALQASRQIATISREQVQQVQERIAEDTLLHYNGMLKSTWDLLAEVQNQSRVMGDIIASQRDLALATIDLQWVLLGGAPQSFVSLGGASSSASPGAGH